MSGPSGGTSGGWATDHSAKFAAATASAITPAATSADAERRSLGAGSTWMLAALIRLGIRGPASKTLAMFRRLTIRTESEGKRRAGRGIVPRARWIGAVARKFNARAGVLTVGTWRHFRVEGRPSPPR